ncbi:hypothetical protein BJ875DRAFT_505233 [Amylocarpus encephaloides]|uniref:Delta(24)-sterol reductase n=1 Tax=Amylocarpus encephaloides TaxID=45428 RepID=A0A9P8C4N2_9HELO|nr:hypothetical protein BJ875DRAFT_505233 [Amylocarpus encephaloides]
MDSHGQAVSKIASQVERFYHGKEPFRIYHGSTNSTRKSQYERERMTALVEPNVPMDALVQATLRHGLVPPVVMEFAGITVGGGFAGTAGESSSFRYGFFHRNVNWIEMVLADGQIVRASSKERSDLFYGPASSFGTLGVTTLLELQLIDAKSHVKMTYYPVTSVREAQAVIDDITADTSFDYCDGIIMTNDISGLRTQGFTRPSDPWFYIHVQRLMQNKKSQITEAIPMIDYLFRYDRGGFWVARYSYTYFLTPFNRITRFLLDYFMHTRVMYHALHKSGLAEQYIVQDVAIPNPQASKFMSYLNANFKQYPIWICPLRQSGRGIASTHSLQAKKTNDKTPDTMLNFGVWGPGSTDRREFVYWNREFEKKVRELGGQKWLYAHTYYTEEEFYEIYNRKEYDVVRGKYHAGHLPSVYDKAKVDVEAEEKRKRESWKLWLLAAFWRIWPFAGLYGLWKACLGGIICCPRCCTRAADGHGVKLFMCYVDSLGLGEGLLYREGLETQITEMWERGPRRLDVGVGSSGTEQNENNAEHFSRSHRRMIGVWFLSRFHCHYIQISIPEFVYLEAVQHPSE